MKFFKVKYLGGFLVEEWCFYWGKFMYNRVFKSLKDKKEMNSCEGFIIGMFKM